MTQGPRVLIAHLFHEGHCFNPVPTRAADFLVHRGADALEAARGSSGIFGGIFARLAAEGAAITAAVSAKARPGGAVERAFFDEMAGLIVDAARAGEHDAICLSLHGAMLADGIADAEGALLARLRAAVGPAPVIAVGLDLHAYLTPTMLACADIVTACKHNPHSDLFETGEQVAALALAAVRGALRPVTALAHLPFMSRGRSETAEGPLSEMHARAHEHLRRSSALRDLSIFNNHSFVDAPGIGQNVLAIAHDDPAPAIAAVGAIGTEYWRRRGEFVGNWPDFDAVLDRVVADAAARPFVMGDKGDNVLAGAPGDHTFLLRRLLARDPPIRVAMPMTDDRAVAACQAVGVGATIDVAVGGWVTPGDAPLPVRGRIVHLGDGHFVNAGAYMRGQPARLGATATLAIGRHHLLLTSEAGLTQDPAAFESQGIRIAEHDLVVAKSFFHFKLSFAGIATPIQADTPGLSSFRPFEQPYTVARPFWPLDAIELTHLPVSVFDHRDRAARTVRLAVTPG
jgi:microcystin degradation protein MlrC